MPAQRFVERLRALSRMLTGIGVLLCWPACNDARHGQADAALVRLSADDLVTVHQGVMRVGPRIAGELQAEEMAVIRAELGGSVTEVRIEQGQKVRRGELLLTIEDQATRDTWRSALTDVHAAEVQLAAAVHQSRRTANLVRAGALPERERELADSAAADARAQRAAAHARLATAREQLAGARVRSPIDGVVSERAVNMGDVVSLGTPLCTVVDPRSLRLAASVPSTALPGLRPDVPVEFQVRGQPGRRFQGKIERVAPTADPATRQIPVLVTIANPHGMLLAGLFAEGRAVLQQQRGLVVPLEAVDESSGRPMVLRLQGTTIERVPVEVGLRDELLEQVELRAGVQEGDRLLVGAGRLLAPGTRVAAPSASQREL